MGINTLVGYNEPDSSSQANIAVADAFDAMTSNRVYRSRLSDQAALDAFQARARRHADVDKVNSTPTFEINGTRLEGEATLKDLAAAIAAARAKP